jgi:hypothetical protein
MTPIEVLKHLSEVCVKNNDGSLSLGTYEVSLIENAIKNYIPVYGGYSADDVVSLGKDLGYNFPDDVATEIIKKIARYSCEITWDVIECWLLEEDETLLAYKEE